MKLMGSSKIVVGDVYPDEQVEVVTNLPQQFLRLCKLLMSPANVSMPPVPATNILPSSVPEILCPGGGNSKLDISDIAKPLDTRAIETPSPRPLPRVSQAELDALRARLMALWNPPVRAQDADSYQITIRIAFKRDGTLASGPVVMTSGSGARFNALRDSVVKAVLVGQPYTMLRPEHYETWKEIDFTFDTK